MGDTTSRDSVIIIGINHCKIINIGIAITTYLIDVLFGTKRPNSDMPTIVHIGAIIPIIPIIPIIRPYAIMPLIKWQMKAAHNIAAGRSIGAFLSHCQQKLPQKSIDTKYNNRVAIRQRVPMVEDVTPNISITDKIAPKSVIPIAA